MGVPGLQSFIERSGDFRKANLVKEAADVRTRQKGIKKPVLIVDMNALRFRVLEVAMTKDVKDRICGESSEKMCQVWKDLLARFRDAQIDLVFVSECRAPREKRSRKILDLFDDIAEESGKVFECLRKGELPEHINSSNLSTVQPMHLTTFLEKEGCEIHVADGEADMLVARLARDRRAFGILTSDTDFLIYHDHRANIYSTKYLDLSRLQTHVYSRSKLAMRLDLRPELLPVWAIYIHIGGYQENFERAADAVKKRKFSRSVDQILLELPDAPLFRGKVDREAMNMLRTYFIRELPIPRTRSPSTPPEWASVVRHFKGSPSLLKGVILHREYDSPPVLEDYSRSDIPFLANQLVPFRKRLYGVLLHELSPEERVVREWCYAGPGSVVADGIALWAEALPAALHHPGLVALRDTHDRSHEMQKMRTYLFAYVVSPRILETPDILGTFSSNPESLFLLCQLFYAQHEVEGGPLLLDWEVRVFIMAHRLMLFSESHDDVRRTLLAAVDDDGFVPDARGVQLGACFNKFPLVYLNSGLGEPFDMVSLMAQCHFGGAAFHRLYKIMKEGANVEALVNELHLDFDDIENVFRIVIS